MEYSPTLISRPDWSSVTAMVRLVLVGERGASSATRLETSASAVFTTPQSHQRSNSVARRTWQGLFKGLLIVITTLTFIWFGPNLWDGLNAGAKRFSAGVISAQQATSNTVSLPKVQPNIQDWPNFRTFNQWLNGLTVTPIAGQSATEAQSTAQSTQAGSTPTPTPTPTIPPYQPPYNPDLPAGTWLVIPRIGIRSELQQGSDSAKALAQGLWQVPDFGRGGSRDLPMIVAGHRYGWDWWWKTDYWKYHSFYLLPKLEPGDQVEVIDDHRKWIYQIYAGEEGAEITDYSADLILYTCKDLNSPIRYFRYARLVDPDQDSQETPATQTVN